MQIEGLAEKDNRILELLKDHARMSWSELGNAVGLSRVAVKTRVEKLEENGEPRKLSNGDLLQVGNIELMFENSDAAARRESTKTLTVINLDDTGTVSLSQGTMANLSKKNSKVKQAATLRDNKKQNAILYAIISIIALAAIGALVYLVMTMRG